MTAPEDDIIIVGAGICGLATALGLEQRGVGVQLVERRANVSQLVHGRPSINLTLGVRGLESLNRLGLADEVADVGVSVSVRHIHPAGSEAVVRPYGTSGETIVSVRRNELVARLLARVAAAERIQIRLDTHVGSLNPTGTVNLQVGDDCPITLTAPLVIGADGLNSVVRRAICQATDAPGAESVNTGCRWIELSHPADWPGGLSDAIDIWPRDPLMIIAFPNPNRIKTVLIFAPDGIELPSYTEVVGLLPELSVTVNSYAAALERQDHVRVVEAPVWSAGRLCLIGDAAHAVTPYLGQGANAALADASLILDLVDEGVGWADLGRRFASLRQPETDCLARLAGQHYGELAHGMADRRTAVANDVRMLLTRHDPARFQPIYNRVAFSRDSLLSAEQEYIDEESAIAPVVDAILATLSPGTVQ